MNNNSIFFQSNEYIPNNLKNFITNELLLRNFKTNQKPEFGNYLNAKILGWGFPNSHTFKIWLHNIFKNKKYYPKSIIINKNFSINNQTILSNFINNQRKILKPNKGHSGKNIHIIHNPQECINNINNNDHWILQEEIKPLLFNGRKFDIRIFHFILRYKNNYYNIISNNGFAKVSYTNFNNNNSSGFITNISFNENKNNNQIKYEYTDFLKKLNKSYSNSIDMEYDIINLIRNYSKDFAKKLHQQNQKYYHLKAQIMILGPDIIINENKEPILIETNCNPAILLKDDLLYKKQKLMILELIDNILIPILYNEFNEEYSGEQLTIEKIIF